MPCLINLDMHHTWLCIMSCLCGGCLLCCASFRCCFFGLVLITSRLWGSVWLRPVLFFMDSFFFLAGSQARWPLPSISLLSLLASCSIYRYVALPTSCLSCLPYCHAKPLTHLPSKPLFGYVTALLNPSYSVVSCRWSWRLLHDGTCLCWDITISLILINASIYLVKGGRLSLMHYKKIHFRDETCLSQ